MNGFVRLLAVVTAAFFVASAASCGLKGPPIAPDAKKDERPEPRSGSGVLQFGPQPEKEDPEDRRILDLYGRKDRKKPTDVPRVEDAIGADVLLGTSGEPKDDPAKANPFDPQAKSAGESATPTPAPSPTPEPQDDPEKP
ncbi:MAG: hypothetical protein KJ042_05715 [Deltaproteobacteria bacterium]|nr:hypothetical protein [Deltaproteobacteria bacterium]